MTKDENKPVGYGAPPIKTRFIPNKSGNPRGRPKGSLNLKTIVQKIARETHKIKEGNSTRNITNVELLLITLKDLATSGNLKAVKELERNLERCNPTSNRAGLLVTREPPSPEEWIREQEILNRFKKPPAE